MTREEGQDDDSRSRDPSLGDDSQGSQAGWRVGQRAEQVLRFMESVRNTEEMSKMKARLLALAFGFFLVAGTAYAGPVPGGIDSDGDTVENAFDNCTGKSNATQVETDHNGCGDACPVTCDVDGNGTVGAGDLLVIASPMNFGMVAPPAPDCDGSTIAGSGDLLVVGMEFGNVAPAGPSGVTTAQCNPATCACTPQ